MKKRWIITIVIVLLCFRACGSTGTKQPAVRQVRPMSTPTQPTAPRKAPAETQPAVTAPPAETTTPAAETQPETTAPAPEPQPETTTPPAETRPGIRPEFKDAMDSYEAFYNEYCDFMQAYMQNPTNLSLLGKYAGMLSKAAEADQKFKDWKEGDLSAEELKYYLDVMTRVQKRMVDLF